MKGCVLLPAAHLLLWVGVVDAEQVAVGSSALFRLVGSQQDTEEDAMDHGQHNTRMWHDQQKLAIALEGEEQPGERFHEEHTEEKVQRAIAFQGNGFHALSLDVGVTVGLMHALQARSSDLGYPGLSKLFQKYATIASTNGGSWYTAGLAYSKHFDMMHLTMAHSPDQAGALFQSLYMDRWNSSCAEKLPPSVQTALRHVHAQLQQSGPDYKKLAADMDTKQAAEFVDKEFGMFEEALKCEVGPHKEFGEAGLVVSTQPKEEDRVSGWAAYVTHLLANGTGINPMTRAGTTDVMPWAEGKLWLCGMTIQTPGGAYSENEHAYAYYRSGEDSISYQGFVKTPNTTFPMYMPAKVAVQFGSGEDSQAVLPTCPQEDCFGVFLKYTASDSQGNNISQLSVPLSTLYNKGFQKVGHLRVVQMVAASSSYMGFLVFHPEYWHQEAEPQLQAGWVTDAERTRATGAAAPWGEAQFTLRAMEMTASQLLAQNLHLAASAGLSSLTDGGFTDNTGVVHAVANGAKVVTSYVNDNMTDLYRLFQGGQYATGPITMGGRLYFKVFRTDRIQAEVAFEANKTCLEVVPGASYLQSFCYGTIVATTASNDMGGTKANQTVVLNIINPVSKLNFFSPAKLFEKQVQDVVSTMTLPANAAAVDDMLNRFFL